MLKKENKIYKLSMKEGKKHGMLGSPQEVRAVMELLADKLGRRMVSMEGLAAYASSGNAGSVLLNYSAFSE